MKKSEMELPPEETQAKSPGDTLMSRKTHEPERDRKPGVPPTEQNFRNPPWST